MPARIILTVIKGPLAGQQFVLDERTTCFAGRSTRCQLRLPGDQGHRTVSRLHCLLDVNPPDIRIRDYGSLNGTRVNGDCIGHRPPDVDRDTAVKLPFPERDLKDGDEIQVGNTVFRVSVIVPAYCRDCGGEIPEEKKSEAACEETPGSFRCVRCRTLMAPPPQKSVTPPSAVRHCAQCRRDLGGTDPNRHGDLICAECRAAPLQVLDSLLHSTDDRCHAFHGYRFVRLLGKGALGAVFLIEHEQTGERVALKTMQPQVAADSHARKMFLREAENTRAPRHRHIV